MEGRRNDQFFKVSLSWNNCANICTNRIKAILGKSAGTLAQIKAEAANCILHYHTLALGEEKRQFTLEYL